VSSHRRSAICACSVSGAFFALGCSFLLDFEKLEGPPADVDSTDDVVRDAAPGPGPKDGDDGETDDGPVSTDEASNADDGPIATPEGGPPLGPSAFGDGGFDSGVSCPGGCDDGDPCTVDVCTPSGCVPEPMQCEPSSNCMEAVCVDGKCEESPRSGIVADGYDHTLSADTVYKSELISTNDRFFTATYGVWEGKSDIVVTSFDATTGEPLQTFKLTDLLPKDENDDDEYVVISPAAMVGDERISLTLNVYAAIRLVRPSNAAGEILRVQLTRDLKPIGGGVRLASAANYRAVSPYVGPAAGQPDNGEPFVVWNGCTTTTPDGPVCVTTEPTNNSKAGIYIHSGSTALDIDAPGDAFIPEPAPLSGLAALTLGATPGAMWMGNLDPSGVSVKTGFANGEPPRDVIQCNTVSGFTGSWLDAGRSRSDLWTVTWSERSGSTNFFSEVTALQCAGTGCAETVIPPPATTCPIPPPDGRLVPGTRAIVVRSLRRPGDPTERVYQCVAYAASDEENAAVQMSVSRVDYSQVDEMGLVVPNETVKIGEVALAKTPLAGAPDRPAIATMAPDRVAISWMQPAAAGGGQELHVQRYRICYDD